MVVYLLKNIFIAQMAKSTAYYPRVIRSVCECTFNAYFSYSHILIDAETYIGRRQS